jgi:Cu-Zn family superoxide dismutase
MTGLGKLAGVAAMALAGVAMAAAHPAGGRHARAVLHDAAGGEVGSATVEEARGKTWLIVEVHGLSPGKHGMHIHTVGKCEAPGFTTAGGHWNPAGKQHGGNNPMGAHMGDLPNLEVGADGTGKIGLDLPQGSEAGLLDADGAALVVHAGEDDLMTDPSGNSGARIACGVFVAG